MWYIAAGILVVGLLITVHELGHFLMAKIVKMPVDTFCLGYGKPFVKGRWRGTTYGIGPVPFGGYVKISGLDPREQELLPEEERASFVLQPLRKRLLVVVGGPMANILSAVLVFFAVFMIGAPGATMTIEKVLADSPAARAGLKDGDEVLKVDGQAVSEWSDVVKKVRESTVGQITVTVKRDGENKDIQTEIGKKDSLNYIGVVARPTDFYIGLGFWRSVQSSIVWTAILVYEIFHSLFLLVLGKVPFRPLSPVGIVQVTSQAARHGWTVLLNFIGFLSVAIGAMNLLPIFPLDGSRVLIWTIEKLKRRTLSAKAFYVVQFIGVGLLLTIMVWAVYLDIFTAIPDPFK